MTNIVHNIMLNPPSEKYSNYKLKSLFDIEKEITGEKTNHKFEEFKEFHINLKSKLNKHEKDIISNFWLNYEKISTENILDWIDPIALANAKKAFKNDKEKQNNKCLDNVVIKKAPLNIKSFDIFDELDKELPNFKEVTNFYRGSFFLNQSRDLANFAAPRPILLLGKPGVGKTHYAKKLSKLLETSYRFFDSNSITGSWVLTGNNTTWKGADAGLIFKEMAKSNTISPIILLDEIDKINTDRGHSPFSVFHQMFEKENAKTFYDEFVDITFDASQVIYILTANDASNIAPSLLSRMNVFYIDNPDEESMKGIVQEIYKNTLAGSKLFKTKLAAKEVDKLTKLSPREVTQTISNNVFKQASLNIHNKSKKPLDLVIEVNTKDFKKSIGFVKA